jgi:DNA invertase Pin-like site-specific DNA recombinase
MSIIVEVAKELLGMFLADAIIVVYKVDRLTRSLADFAKLVELFDAQGTSVGAIARGRRWLDDVLVEGGTEPAVRSARP